MKADFKRYPVTWGLLGLTLATYIIMFLIFQDSMTSSLAVYLSGGMLGQAIKADPSQMWRLLSPIFIHIGFEHLLMNSISLYFAGRIGEQVLGRWQFLIFYLLAGVSGNALTFFLTPDVVSAGASTSLFGLFAGLVVLGHYGRNPYLRQTGRTFLILIILNLMTSLFSPDVSLAGHLGGAIGGGLLAVVLPNKLPYSLFSKQKRLQAGLIYLSLVLALVLIPLVLI